MTKSNTSGSKKNINKIFKFSLFLVTVFLLDLIIGSLLNVFYFKQKSGIQYRSTYSIEETTADLLIFGSSTAVHNYYPGDFEKYLKMSTYNVGMDGNYIFYHYAVLQAVLKRYRPKVIIFDFTVQEFTKDQESYDRIASLLPYFKKHPEIRPLVELKGPFEKYKLLSNIYPYNSSIFTIAVGNTEINKKNREDINGYVRLTNVWNGPINDGSIFVNYELDDLKIKIYESFINDCIDAKVELYVVCSPYFSKPNYVSSSVVLGKKIASKYNVRFLDFSKDSTILNNHRLFADIGHLNDVGSRFYSNKVANTILDPSKITLAIGR